MKPYIAKDGLNWLSFTTNLHCNLYSIILILILTNRLKNHAGQDKSYKSTNDNLIGNVDNDKSDVEYSMSAK